MRKLPILLASLMLLSCTACGDSDDDSKTGKSTSGNRISDDDGSVESSSSDITLNGDDNEESSSSETSLSDDDNEESVSSDIMLDGDYCTIVPITGKKMTEDISIDDYLEESRLNNKEVPFKALSFDGSDFEMTTIVNPGVYHTYEGDYKVSDGKIIYNYKKTVTVDKEGEKKSYYLTDGVPEVDQHIIMKTKKVTDEEYKAEVEKKKQAAIVERMIKFNDTGTFYTFVGNRMDFSDRYVAYNVMPMVVQNVMSGNKRDDIPAYLYPVDDLICVPTYGTELDGSYKYGKDFTIVYNAMDTFLEDEYSKYYVLGWDKDSQKVENLRSTIESQLGSTDDTKIEFSDGKWKWYNSAGELINDGIYKESEEYKGLIAMFITDDSLNCVKDFKILSPEFLYLDDSGKIWIPYMMKAN